MPVPHITEEIRAAIKDILQEAKMIASRNFPQERISGKHFAPRVTEEIAEVVKQGLQCWSPGRFPNAGHGAGGAPLCPSSQLASPAHDGHSGFSMMFETKLG